MASEMRAVLLTAYTDPPSLTLSSLPRPTPSSGQVLVRISFAPINPSDLEFIRGTYAYRKELPTVPGFEGAGVVVESGGGLIAGMMVGRKVAVRHNPTGQGTWAEFIVCAVDSCTVLVGDIDLEQAACMFINPMTAMLFRELAIQSPSKSVLQNAAGSSLGKMVRKLLPLSGVTVVNVVRSEAAANRLREEGEKWVLDSSEGGFQEKLMRVCRDLDVKIAFDAVGGEATGTLVQCLPDSSTTYVYGLLSGSPSSGIPCEDLLFHSKRVEGLWMPVWLRSLSSWRKLRLSLEVQRLLPGVLKSEIAGRWGLDRAGEAVAAYQRDMSAGKVLILPSV